MSTRRRRDARRRCPGPRLVQAGDGWYQGTDEDGRTFHALDLQLMFPRMGLAKRTGLLRKWS